MPETASKKKRLVLQSLVDSKRHVVLIISMDNRIEVAQAIGKVISSRVRVDWQVRVFKRIHRVKEC